MLRRRSGGRVGGAWDLTMEAPGGLKAALLDVADVADGAEEEEVVVVVVVGQGVCELAVGS